MIPNGGTLGYASRKDEHLNLAVRLHDLDRQNAFDDVSFTHHALPGTSIDSTDPGMTVSGICREAPFYINAITGGTRAMTEINAGLAGAVADVGMVIACGSQHITLWDPGCADDFRIIRSEASQALVLVNVGPVATPEGAVRTVEMFEADVLQIHFNAVQELVMSEGDRDFRDWPERIVAIVAAVSVPVVAKEVDFDLSHRAMATLERAGIAVVDVAGVSGTDFIVIENERRSQRDYLYPTGWGQSVVLCLLDTLWGGESIGLPVSASGGVCAPLGVVRLLVLGARAVGVSGYSLRTLVKNGLDGLRRELRMWTNHVCTLMTLLGTADVGQLCDTDVLVTEETAEWAHLLGIDSA